MNTQEMFEEFQNQVAILSRKMDEGKVRFDEIMAIVEKIGLVRNTDDGFGEIHFTMSRDQRGKDVTKIETKQIRLIK